MMRLRAAAVLLAVAACGRTDPPVELRTIAAEPAVVPPDAPRRLPPPTTTIPATTSTTGHTATYPPTTAPPAPDRPPMGGCAGYEGLIAAHFPADQVGKACAVMMCETAGTGSPTIHNPSSSASGLFQFLDRTWTSTTGLEPPAAAYPAGEQVAAAARLWRSSGWGPWACAPR